MDDMKLPDLFAQEHGLHPLLLASNSCSIVEALENLINVAKTADGRQELASKNVINQVFELCQTLSYPSSRTEILLSLKLLRNLCAGESHNQNAFLQQNGVRFIFNSITNFGFGLGLDNEVIRICLQVLGNVSLAGADYQHAVWHQFFPLGFFQIAGVQDKDVSDPLCMVIYTCCEGSDRLIVELCGDQGLPIIAEIVRTASVVGFKEDWLKLLLSVLCLENFYFASIFLRLQPLDALDYCNTNDHFTAEQAYLLAALSDILNERIKEVIVPSGLALYVLGILRNSVRAVDFSMRGTKGLPTGVTATDILGYSLTILRDICASDGLTRCTENGSVDVVYMLTSDGLIELLLELLRKLVPPTTIRKVVKQGQSLEETTTCPPMCCPYKGYRRDIVAILGNCAYRRKHVQDEIRQRNGIFLLLQHCVTDEENPFLREWGIWSVRNMLEGNPDNQQAVSDLEMQEPVDVPELAGLGLRVEVDTKTRRAKLMNIS